MSARNNQDRLGNPEISNPGPPSPPVMSENTEDVFSFPTPTEFVELPSRGLFYPEGHPLHNQEVVEIRYMTAKDEDILTSQSLMKKGLALDKLIQNVLIDKSVRPSDLLIGDKNAILVASRITGYGSNYDVDLSCPSCFTRSSHSFDLEEVSRINYGDKFDENEATLTDRGTYLVKLPLTKAVVEAKMLTGADETKLMKLSEKKKKLNLPESSLTDQFRSIIVAVGNEKSDSVRHSFVERLPARDARYLRNVYTKINPNLDLISEFQEEVNVPITVQFFWPK